MKVKSFSRLRILATPWTAAYQAPPSMGFSRQEYWSGVPLPSSSTGVGCHCIFPLLFYNILSPWELMHPALFPSTLLILLSITFTLSSLIHEHWHGAYGFPLCLLYLHLITVIKSTCLRKPLVQGG